MTRSGTYTPPGGAPENQSLTRRFVYDNFQRLCKQIEPESGVTVMDYDASNNVSWQAIGQNLTSISDCQRSSVAANQRSERIYDGLNRLIAIDHPAGTDDIAMGYTADGLTDTASVGILSSTTPVNFSELKNQWTYSFNRRRLLTTETLSLDGRNQTLSWRYNARGDQEGLIYPSGLDISFLPNAYGEARQAGAFTTNVTRHPNGAIAGMSYGNGLVQSTTQNLRLLPLRRIVGTRMDQTHSYDENANILTLTDATSGNPETRTLAYDGLDRMIQADAPNQLGNERYRFDALDNIRQANLGSDTLIYGHNSQNRLTAITKNGSSYFSYGFNAQGDVTSRNGASTSNPELIFANGFENALQNKQLKFAQNQIHSYDRAHRLTGINGLESDQYDAHNRRVLTTRTSDGLKRYQLYSKSGVLMHTEDQRSNEVIDYINLEGQLIAERSAPIGGSGVTTKYQHSDLRGSPTVVTNAAGTQLERSFEQPFGAPYDGIYRDGPGFTGHATDAASGLSYMQQRYYDPIAMRFLSVDPAQSEFSRYSYGANNPYKFVDPDGRAAVVAVGPMIEGCAANPLCRGAAQQTSRAVVQQVGIAVNATIGETLKEMLHDAMQAQAQAQAAQMVGAENAEPGEDKPDEKPESDSGNSGKRERTEHAIERATEAKTDSSRQVGDANRVIRDGRNFTDSKTGNNVHVKGDRVVITDRSGKIVSQFKNPRANTQGRIQSGRWVPE